MWVIILAFYRPSSGKAITSDDPPNGRTVVEFNKGTLAGPTSISHLFTAGILSAPEPRYNFSFPWPVKGQALARLYCEQRPSGEYLYVVYAPRGRRGQRSPTVESQVKAFEPPPRRHRP